jgi:hypothetical protein
MAPIVIAACDIILTKEGMRRKREGIEFHLWVHIFGNKSIRRIESGNSI